jgi:hypothetical protein
MVAFETIAQLVTWAGGLQYLALLTRPRLHYLTYHVTESKSPAG